MFWEQLNCCEVRHMDDDDDDDDKEVPVDLMKTYSGAEV
jgi:hypothetical protein